jgi:hypothetical protein
MRKTLAALVLLALPTLAGAQSELVHFERSSVPSTGGTITANLGAELAPAIGAGTGWTCGAGWDCSVAGTLNKNADGVGTAVPNPAITAVVGTTYKVIITVGAVTVGNGATYTLGGVYGPSLTAAGVQPVAYIRAETTANLIITPTPATTRFTITNVSVKPLTDATGDLEVQGGLTVDSMLRVWGTTRSGPWSGGYTAKEMAIFNYNGAGVNTDISSVTMRAAPSGYVLQVFNTGSITTNATSFVLGNDTTLYRAAAATLQLGAANAAAPVQQFLTAQGCRSGTDSDCAGKQLTIGPTATSGGTGLALPAGVTLNRGIRTTTGSGAQAVQSAYVICGSQTLSTTTTQAQVVLTVTTTTLSAGGLTLHYHVAATSATAADATTGSVNVSWNNVGGTVNAVMSAAISETQSNSSGTLAAIPTVTVATNVVSIKLTPTWVTIVPTAVRGMVTVLNQGIDPVVCQ